MKTGVVKLPVWPNFEQDEIDAATATLRSGRVNYWTGEEGRQFESEFAGFHGARFGVAVANGSVALGLALRALRLPAGAEIIVTPRTFVASVSEIVLAGCVPVFADVDPLSQNVTAQTIEAVVTPRTAVILTVHLAGWPCDMPAIMALAGRLGLKVVEDCAQAHGASLDGQRVGHWGNLAAFSFCQDKIMSTGGEGGMVLTDDPDLWESVWSSKDHGKSVALLGGPAAGNGFKWVHESIGTNGRLTEFQAAIGRIQLRKLESWLDQRRANAKLLDEALAGLPALRVVRPPARIGHARYKYYCFIDPEALASGWSRDRIVDEVAARGVPVGSGICPEVYREQAFVGMAGLPIEPLPVARQLGETSLMLPVHPGLEPAHILQMAEVIDSVMSMATR